MIVIFAKEERGVAVENARALKGRARGARRRNEDILVLDSGRVWWVVEDGLLMRWERWTRRVVVVIVLIGAQAG